MYVIESLSPVSNVTTRWRTCRDACGRSVRRRDVPVARAVGVSFHFRFSIRLVRVNKPRLGWLILRESIYTYTLAQHYICVYIRWNVVLYMYICI